MKLHINNLSSSYIQCLELHVWNEHKIIATFHIMIHETTTSHYTYEFWYLQDECHQVLIKRIEYQWDEKEDYPNNNQKNHASIIGRLFYEQITKCRNEIDLHELLQ